ncbi:MAG: hypothetical protein ACHREM_19830, partial [Polyangiales bacterium]
MKRARVVAIVAVVAMVASSIGCSARLTTPPPSTCTSPAPDYRADVAPLVERRCARCHAGDGAAADEHDFSRFDVIHAQASRVADQL